LTNADVRRQLSAELSRRSSGRPPRRAASASTSGERRAASAGGARRRGRKRLEVTSRLDRTTTQLEREAGLQAGSGPDASPKAAPKQKQKQKKDRSAPRPQKAQRKASGAGAGRQRPAELSEAQQLVERKRQQRSQRKRKSSARQVLSLLGVIAAICGLVFGVNYALHSPLFAVSDVRVTGNHLLTKAEVTALAALPPGRTVPLLSVRSLQKNLERNAWISSAKVSRHLPHRVTLEITERKPVAYLDDGSGKKRGWLISHDGVWLGYFDAETATVSASATGGDSHVLSAEERAQIIVITDVEDRSFALGAPAKDATIKNMLAIINGISPELRAQIASVSAPNVAGTKLYLKGMIEVDIGSAEPIADKDKTIRAILEKQKGKVNLINVLAVDKATWRGLTTAE